MVINSPKSLDFRAILNAALRPFAVWLIAVVFIVWSGFIGVACMTPVAWLLALQTGQQAVRLSASLSSRTRQLEAALAGGLLGLLQGILFVIATSYMESSAPSPAADEPSALGFGLAIMCMGIFAAAGLAWFSAWLLERRRTPQVGTN